jgi:hypothetical protein
VRLFNETREALDQQRASAEVLTAISNSIADTTPVFETILERCEKLFAGNLVQINVVGEDGLQHLAAYHGPNRSEIEPMFPMPVDETSAAGRVMLRREALHFSDVDNDPDVPPRARRGWEVLGVKAVISAPMVWEGRGIGAIHVGRDRPGPFSGKEIALLRTFADQAVIAIQNARMFNETREALQRQTATAEVLQVIGSSVKDTGPVFEKILDSCERLFETAHLGIVVARDDGFVHAAAVRGSIVQAMTRTLPRPIDASVTGRVMRELRVLQIPDIAEFARSDRESGAWARRWSGRVAASGRSWWCVSLRRRSSRRTRRCSRPSPTRRQSPSRTRGCSARRRRRVPPPKRPTRRRARSSRR